MYKPTTLTDAKTKRMMAKNIQDSHFTIIMKKNYMQIRRLVDLIIKRNLMEMYILWLSLVIDLFRGRNI